jgi:translation initiation factor IF-3
VIDETGNNIGVMSLKEALELSLSRGLDLIEISPNVVPPIAKITDYGKFQYEQNKKLKKAKAGSKATETKSIQIKIGTGEHDLALKAKQTSNWLKEGHRVKIELFLAGRTKYMAESFLKERIDRLLQFITENYKISDPYKKTPKGLIIVIEKS